MGDTPLVIRHKDRYLHTLVAGTTGTGKTSRVLKPMIYQDLLAIKRGLKAGHPPVGGRSSSASHNPLLRE
ncbi:MAG: hypothetical protein ACYC9Q_14790 [Bacillota bacterium]